MFTQLPLQGIAVQNEFKMMLQHIDQVLTNIWYQIDIKVPAGIIHIFIVVHL